MMGFLRTHTGSCHGSRLSCATRYRLPLWLSIVIVILATVILAAPAFAEKRVALVIGNGDYANLPDLRNPVNDATDIAGALRKLGFAVTLKTDADRRSMNQAIVAFREELASDASSEGVFYFAGHGVQSPKGQNYLMPVDAAVKSETDLEDEAVRAQKLLDSLDEARNRVNLVILDACRDNPLPAAARSSGSRGLAVVAQAPPETVVLYSTAAGQTASDGAAGSRNSPFTAALLKHIASPGDITQVVKLVMGDVKATTPERQTPFVYSNLSRDFALNPAAIGRAVSTTPSKTPSFGAVTAATGNLSITLAAAGTVSVAGLSASVPAGTVPVNDLPAGSQTVTVRYADGKSESRTITVPSGGTASVAFAYVPAAKAAEKPAASPLSGTPGRTYRNEVWIEGGSFRMGSDVGESDEKPVHTVTVSGFWIMSTEVTQGDYRALMGTNPSKFKGDTLPVEQVSWYDAVAFANALSKKDGLAQAYSTNGINVGWNQSANGWRLPTEAEWEYAARGGSKSRGYRYAGGDSSEQVAWYSGNSGNKTQAVRTKAPNELGLYDMSGNVWEWSHEDNIFVSGSLGAPLSINVSKYRGGCWSSDTLISYSPDSVYIPPHYSHNTIGFRLVRKP